jgi:hypothetical protein
MRMTHISGVVVDSTHNPVSAALVIFTSGGGGFESVGMFLLMQAVHFPILYRLTCKRERSRGQLENFCYRFFFTGRAC